MRGGPQRIGNYELLLELASGGMATVYLARMQGAGGFERVVALKRVHPHLLRDRSFHDMFRDEARIASMVRHPNVVPVVDVVESEGELLLVMDYVESSSLSSLRKAATEAGKEIAPAVVARILYDTLQGLHAAHEAVDLRGHPLDIVHRDVSPQNLVVSIDGSTRLLDFGVAKAQNRLTETRSGGVKGKYAYMSPEQVRGEAIDRRTDIFAAGIILWETLTGGRLFAGDNEMDTMRRISLADVPDPVSLNPRSPAVLTPVLRKALARDREARFQTAQEMAEAIEQALRPASPRVVAEALQELCGDRLQARRDALAAALEGNDAALSDFPRSRGSSSWSQPRGLSRPPESATPPGSFSRTPSGSLSRTAPEPPAEGTLSLVSEPTAGSSPSGRGLAPDLLTPASQPSLAQLQPAMPPGYAPPPSSRLRGVVFAGVAMALGAVLTLLFTAGRAPPERAASVASAPAPPATSVSAAPPPSAVIPAEIELVLTAEAPIESVRAPGLVRSEIEGKQARLTLAPWAGQLAIEATLAGGKSASVSAPEAGPRRLSLVPVKKGGGAAAGAPRRELQANPYGTP